MLNAGPPPPPILTVMYAATHLSTDARIVIRIPCVVESCWSPTWQVSFQIIPPIIKTKT